jgi:hypothetical protein
MYSIQDSEIEVGSTLYRYMDSYDESPFNKPYKLIEWDVIKITNQGCWIEEVIEYDYGEFMGEILQDTQIFRRWMSRYANVLYAWPTKELAWKSYIIRKHREFERVEKKYNRLKWLLKEIDSENTTKPKPRKSLM